MPYAGKHPEELYDKSFVVIPEQGEPYEDTLEDYFRGIRNPRVCRYAVRVTKSGPRKRWAEVELYPLWLATQDVPRMDKQRATTPEQQKVNDRNTRRRFTRKINENFHEGKDLYFTVTADNEHLPISEQQAGREFTNYLERLRYEYVKAGHDRKDFKYVYCIEWTRARDQHKRYIRDTDGNYVMRPHWHVVITGDVPAKVIRRQWRLGKRIHVDPLSPDSTGYSGIARYIAKPETKEAGVGKRRFATSTNLITPKPTVAICHKQATKRKVQTIAANENLRPAFFEKLTGSKYRFVDCEARYNEINDGVYIYCRLELKREDRKGGYRDWGYEALWEE